MSKDPEKSGLQGERAEVVERSRAREILRRAALVLAVVLCIRVFSVYSNRPHLHHHHQHPAGAPPRHGPRPDRWQEKPQPRLSLEEREKLILSIPDAESARAASKEYTAHAHPAGSAYDEQDALRMLKFFQEELQIPPSEAVFDAGSKESRWATLGLTNALFGPRGPTAWVDTYYPVMDTGVEQRLEILGKDGSTVWTADLVEDGDPLDPDAHKHRDSVPTWHGASGDGDVEGQLIYANYGTRADYLDLVAAGADLTGKIVITRYGGVLRGLKIRGAEDLGAVGVLMYDDPRDDGYITVENGFEPYPAGPARNPTAVQRGSVAYVNLYPGDPSTPGLPAYPDSNRTEGTNGPRIPSLPISWANAQRLLSEIDGSAEARTLNGRPSDAAVRLVNHLRVEVMPIWNTMAAIPGHVRDEVIVIGNHRDGWVLGASDPISGTAALHEVVRGFGALLRAGWKPLRTIVFANWDAEEYGLIGSTEYGEDFADWLAKHAVAYVNVDGAVSGSRFGAAASPSLSHLILDSARDVPHPTIPGKTLFDAQTDNGPISIAEARADLEYMGAYEAIETRRQEAKGSNLLQPLGSGSDFTVFLDHLGIASSSTGFGSTPQDAIYHYHSIYDSQRWQELHADPGFHRVTAVAKHLSLMLLRLTDSIIVPLNTTQYALELHDYLDEVEEIVSRTPLDGAIDLSALRNTIRELNAASIELDAEKEAAEKEFTKLLSQLPKFPRRYGKRRGFTRHLVNFIKRVFGVAPHNWHRSGLHIPAAWEEYLDAQFTMDRSDPESPHLPRMPPIFKFIKAAKRVTKANKKLAAFERGFLSEEGIKGQEWYKHVGVAPGRWLGYGATTFPGLNQALAIDKDVSQAKREAEHLIVLLTKLTEDLRA
ncbi:Zn-dependent exopeptidase [Mycena albidolilacea]|uniref:Zn-dependent exopeptidase n=1 Tax=Mycena albidolilacea TaxID=1033008 RepID=A0AAD7F7C1_9AGAR|nr:Zn-dependent exopeptidase [Mycena albidolilacea]